MSDKEEKKRRRATTLFPKNTLKSALKIPKTIWDNNAGEPYNRYDIAQSLGYSTESSSFRTLITSSNKYGLSEGSYSAEKLNLTELGKILVGDSSEKEKNESIVNALFNVDFFGKFLEKFNQKKLPREDLLKKTLTRDFNIPEEDVELCLQMLMDNLTD